MKRLTIKGVQNVRGQLFAATSHHERLRETLGVHVISTEQVDEFVRDDTQPL